MTNYNKKSPRRYTTDIIPDKLRVNSLPPQMDRPNDSSYLCDHKTGIRVSDEMSTELAEKIEHRYNIHDKLIKENKKLLDGICPYPKICEQMNPIVSRIDLPDGIYTATITVSCGIIEDTFVSDKEILRAMGEKS